LKVAEVLLDLGAEVDAMDRDDWMPLHVALAYGHEEIAQMLLKHGADAKALDNGIRTP
jgi:ankyrin repeat protein